MFKIRTLGSSVAVLVMVLACRAQAQQPKPIDKVQGATGRFQVTLTERSPLSNPLDVAKRISLKTVTKEPDYELPKEVFEAFVPKSPGDDGKYGLMVPIPFPGHGFPPSEWVDVLEKHHLIWLGDQNGGTTPTASIGLALDAVHNAGKAWPIDPTRVYTCPAGTKSTAQGIALYYPEIFQGQLCSAVAWWFTKVTDSHTRALYSVDFLARPLPEQMALAKTRGRFFFAGRESSSPPLADPVAVVAKEYERVGFKHVKAVSVPQDQMTVWSHYPSTWFEQGVEFLDAGTAEVNAVAAKPVATQNPSPSAGSVVTPAGTAPPAASSADDANRKAASALSLAKNYVNNGQYETARKKLQSLLDTYPASPSAADAKALLDEIKDK